MTTIKQLSEELGVSKQAIYNRITKEPLKTMLAGIEGALQTNAQGTIYLSEAGEQAIRNAYEEKYKRPGEAFKQNTRPVGVVATAAPPARVEFDDSKLDNILLQINNMQESLQSLSHQLVAKDAYIDKLNNQLEERNLKNAELSRTAKKLTELAAAKETEIQALKDRCANTELKAANLQQQMLDLENEIVVGDTNEPDPPTYNDIASNQQPATPILPATEQPTTATVLPTTMPTTEQQAVPETVAIEPTINPAIEMVAAPQTVEPEAETIKPAETIQAKTTRIDLDFYEPLIDLSGDLNSPTSRLAGLVVNK